jgi:hypothetical protein
MWFLRLSVRSVLVESGAHPEVSDTVRGLCLGRFRERLRRRARKRCLALFIIGVHEWSNGRPHLHVLLITAILFTEDELWALWKACCRGCWAHCYCKPARTVPAAVAYVFKCVNDPEKKELVPKSFRGRVVFHSRGFLTKPLRQLLKDYRQRRLAAEACSPRVPFTGTEVGPGQGGRAL